MFDYVAYLAKEKTINTFRLYGFFFIFFPQLKLYSYHVNGHVLNKVYSKYGEM